MLTTEDFRSSSFFSIWSMISLFTAFMLLSSWSMQLNTDNILWLGFALFPSLRIRIGVEVKTGCVVILLAVRSFVEGLFSISHCFSLFSFMNRFWPLLSLRLNSCLADIDLLILWLNKLFIFSAVNCRKLSCGWTLSDCTPFTQYNNKTSMLFRMMSDTWDDASDFLWSDDNVWHIFDPDQIHKMSIFVFRYTHWHCFLWSKLFFGTSNDTEYQVLNIC